MTKKIIRFYKEKLLKGLCFVVLLFTIVSCTKAKKTGSSDPANTSTQNVSKASTFFGNLDREPETLHPIRSVDGFAGQVQSYVLESLLTRDVDTYELKPHLAEKWTTTKDHKSFTFTLRPNVKWHDGRPLTAKDVAFSFKVSKDPSYGGPHLLPYFESIDSVEVLDDLRVRFKIKKKYFNNLAALGTIMDIIPEHIYKDKEKKLNHVLIGSGPYVFKKYEKGKKIILEQNKNWWGRSVKSDTHTIPQIVFRFISNENDQLIRMAGGLFDVLFLSTESYMKKTNKPPWGESITKREVQNKQAKGYSYIGWNLNNPLFKDKNTRRALNYLMNRNLMNKKFEYGKSKLATGPWYSWSDYADPSVKPILFNPKKASELLSRSNWADTDKNGILDKMVEGRKLEFKFTLIFSNQEAEKYFSIYQQDLKKNGISMSLRLMDWSAFLKIVQEKKFSAVGLGWGGVQWT